MTTKTMGKQHDRHRHRRKNQPNFSIVTIKHLITAIGKVNEEEKYHRAVYYLGRSKQPIILIYSIEKSYYCKIWYTDIDTTFPNKRDQGLISHRFANFLYILF